MLAKLSDLDLLGLLRSVGVIGAGVDLELAVHRVAHFGFWEHAANRFLDETDRTPLAHVHGALFREDAFKTAVPAIELLRFLAPGEFNGAGVDDDDVIARVDVRGI